MLKCFSFRSALLDSQKACELNPDYLKAKIRIAQCFYELEKYTECLQTCDEILTQHAYNEKINQLRKDALTKKVIFCIFYQYCRVSNFLSLHIKTRLSKF